MKNTLRIRVKAQNSEILSFLGIKIPQIISSTLKNDKRIYSNRLLLTDFTTNIGYHSIKHRETNKALAIVIQDNSYKSNMKGQKELQVSKNGSMLIINSKALERIRLDNEVSGGKCCLVIT